MRLDDFSTLTRARTLTRAVNDTPTMLGVARDLLVALDPQRPVRLLGVRVAGLDAEPPMETSAGAESQLELTL